MSATVIDRSLRWRKAWVGEGTHGDTHRGLLVAFFSVEHRCSADRTESEPEPGSLVPDAHIFRCGAENPIGRGESGQRREHTAGPTLTGETVADANPEGFAKNFNAQLAAGTSGCSRSHSVPRAMCSRTMFTPSCRSLGADRCATSRSRKPGRCGRMARLRFIRAWTTFELSIHGSRRTRSSACPSVTSFPRKREPRCRGRAGRGFPLSRE